MAAIGLMDALSFESIHLVGASMEGIPGAEFIVFEGMGHGFEKPLWTEFANRRVEIEYFGHVTKPALQL